MADNGDRIAVPGKVSGKMFLYRDPQLLTAESHRSKGFKPAERPFDFVRTERAIPLTMTEFSSAQRHYPIIFSNIEQPLPLAVVGLIEEINLFVDDKAEWNPLCYIPMYLRCYPFAFAMEEGGKVAVVVDEAADSVSDEPEYPFFVDGNVSEHTEALMRLCAQYDAERRQTLEFSNTLRDMGLLTPLRATHTPAGATEPEPLVDYVGIDQDKFNALDKDQVYDLHSKGYLAAIYLQMYSLENWRHLMARKVMREKGTVAA